MRLARESELSVHDALFSSKFLLMLKHLALAEKACENVALHLKGLGDYSSARSFGPDLLRAFSVYEGCAAGVHMLLKGLREQLESAGDPEQPVDELVRALNL